MPDLNKAPTILEKALAEWRKRQTLRKGKISVAEFADFLNYSRSLVGFWLNGDRSVSESALISILPKLADLLGLEVYDELNIPRPDPYLQSINSSWERIPPDKQLQLAEDAKRYEAEASKQERRKDLSKPRKTTSN
jgi:transcriptional regulator with XRE-family HTH domain